MAFADWVGQRLVVRDVDGSLQPPGAGPGLRQKEPDGGEFTAIARGDSFDLYFGRETIYNYAITPKVALRFSLWVLWWWVWYACFGLKLRLWRWVLTASLAKRRKEVSE
jgi:hypothetical protein